MQSVLRDAVNAPPGAQEVDRAPEEIVVEDSAIHREHPHQQNDVAPIKEGLKDLRRATASI